MTPEQIKIVAEREREKLYDSLDIALEAARQRMRVDIDLHVEVVTRRVMVLEQAAMPRGCRRAARQEETQAIGPWGPLPGMVGRGRASTVGCCV